MSGEETAHVLVVDDDARIRDLLRRFLHRNGYLCTVARDGAHARRLVESLAFDLLIVDVMMPGEDGIALTRGLRDRLDVPVLLLTARGETADRIIGLEAGADDYLAKPFEPRELLLRVAAILRRTVVAPAPRSADARVLTLGAGSYDTGSGTLTLDDAPVRLTASEQALMRVLAASPHEAVCRARLAEELGEEDAPVQDRAVDVQITRLRRKIEADPKVPRYLQTVRGAGYMLVPD